MGTLDLRDLIASEEEWLCERVLTHALAHGYTADSSTLELAWRSAICGLSEPMKLMLDKGFQPPEIFRDPDPGVSPLIAFSARQAQTHRARGIPLADFLGLMKYYRRAYLDLIARHYPPGDEADRHTEFVNAFFESAEIGICAGWEDRDETADLREAAETNRRLVNEKNRYLTIFETLDEPVLLIDASGKISNFNLAASHLFDEKAVAGRGYYGKDALSGLSDQIAGLVPPAGDTTEFEHVLKTRRGPRAFRIKMQRMLDVSEKFTDTVIIMTDITDFRRAQRASEAADRAKTAFLATVSHEIRNSDQWHSGDRRASGRRAVDREATILCRCAHVIGRIAAGHGERRSRLLKARGG